MSVTMVQAVIAEDVGGDNSVGFPSLARQFYEPVYRFLLSQLPTEADAADLTQEVFLKAHKAFSRYDPSRDFAPWIFTIARRGVADFYRQRKKTTELAGDPFTDPSPDPHEMAVREERAALVWLKARQLKPKFHQVLLLHYQEQFSVAETAEIMGVSETHVKVLLFRARNALKRLFPEEPMNGGQAQ